MLMEGSKRQRHPEEAFNQLVNSLLRHRLLLLRR